MEKQMFPYAYIQLQPSGKGRRIARIHDWKYMAKGTEWLMARTKKIGPVSQQILSHTY